MSELLVSHIIEKDLCISAEDGDKIYHLVESSLDKGQSVTLNFEGVEMIISAFLNAAVGKLLQKYSYNFLKEHLWFTNLRESDRDLLERVIENAQSYFANPKRMDKFLRDMQ